MPSHGKNVPKVQESKPMHEVSDSPYQVSDSLCLESISEDVNQINQVFVNIEIGNTVDCIYP
jgi:hypothetical protein